MSEEQTSQESEPEQNQFDKSQYFKDRSTKEVDLAAKHGWKDNFDEHVSSGGDPDKWVSAEVFNQIGKSIKSSMKQNSNHSKELIEAVRGVNEVHRVEIELKLADLIRERGVAIEDGEADRVNQLDGAIDKTKENINKIKVADQKIASVPDDDYIHETAWSQENKWLHDQSPKGSYGRDVSQKFIAEGLRGEVLTNRIESEMLKAFPLVNEKRNKPGMSDKGSKKSTSKTALTMDSLTSEERDIAQVMMNRNMSKEEVLKKVALSRA